MTTPEVSSGTSHDSDRVFAEGAKEHLPAYLADGGLGRTALDAPGSGADYELREADTRLNPEWVYRSVGLDPAREKLESKRIVCGNGVLMHNPSIGEPSPGLTYIEGLFEPMEQRVPEGVNVARNEQSQVESLLPVPDYWALELYIDGEPASVVHDSLVRDLDIQHGTLYVNGTLRNKDSKIVDFSVTQILDVREPNQALMRTTFMPRESGSVTVLAGIDGSPRKEQPDYYASADIDTPVRAEDGLVYTAESLSGNVVAIAQKARMTSDDMQVAPNRFTSDDRHRKAWQQFDVDTEPGKPFELVTASSVFASNQDPDPTSAVNENLAEFPDFKQRLKEHMKAWEDRWAEVGLSVWGDDTVQMALRFNLAHLLAETRVGSDWPGIGAKIANEPGEGYFGHSFWDMDIFTLPALSRELQRTYLLSRYNELENAKRKAHEHGYEGAWYPWESVPSGEGCPKYSYTSAGNLVEIKTLSQAVHISADVAYAVNRYVEETGDTAFMADYGAEVMLEATRFLVSRATRRDDGSYVYEHVTGPDEYHEDVTNNVYTLLMAANTIQNALGLLDDEDAVSETLKQKIGLSDEELSHWRDVRRNLYIPFDPETLEFEAFEGWDKLPRHVDLKDYPGVKLMEKELLKVYPPPKGVPDEELTDVEKNPVLETDVIKQHDAVLALTLLGSKILDFLPEQALQQLRSSGKSDQQIVREINNANYFKYAPQTSDGSSLSPSTGVLAGLQAGIDPDTLYEQFHQLAAMDLSAENTHHTENGLHSANAGASVWAFQEGFMGISFDNGEVNIQPHLPSHWTSVERVVSYQGKQLRVKIDNIAGTVSATDESKPDGSSTPDKPLPVVVGGRRVVLDANNNSLDVTL